MSTHCKKPRLSFIIPALNEEANIIKAIQSIKNSIKNHEFEIIVVDNGSKDATTTLSEKLGAKVLERPKLTIAGLRNEGVHASSGDLLVFIDADVTLGPDWEISLEMFLNSISSPMFLTGSTCTPTKNNNFFSSYWFNLLKISSAKYINTGHLITTRDLFLKLDGFNAKLKTAEDVDFCIRSDRLGARIVRNPKLIAYHHGYPTRLKEFILREAWHGQQDLKNIKSFLTSKTALAAAINSSLLIGGTALSVKLNSVGPFLSTLVFSQLFCLLVTYKKFGKVNLRASGGASVCCQAYLLGRTLSLAIKIKSPRKR